MLNKHIILGMSDHVGKNIAVVLFDHDDTLVGTIDAKWAHHKFTARKYYNKEITDSEIRLHWGKPLQELVCLLYGTTDTEQALAYNAAHHKDYPKELFTASVPTLRRLKAVGKHVGIITATSRFSFEHDLTRHKIPRNLLDYTQTADDTQFHKPNPLVFSHVHEWLKTKNIKPKEVLYVGDGLHDMKAALGAGFNFLGVETGLVTAGEFKKAGAASVKSMADVFTG